MSNSLRLTIITLLLAVSKLSAATQYVPPGGSIQQAVNAAAPGDPIFVGNGVYGGFVVDNPVALVSVNGPQFTVIDGHVSLCDGASLTGFTITNGLAISGGGVFCDSTNAFLTNCVIVGNSAVPLSDSVGGGVIYGTLYNCVLSGNTATYGGGGAAFSTLYNCTLVGNSVEAYGGGALTCTLYNCIVCSNTAAMTPYQDDYYCLGSNCWENNDPRFVDYANGNLRLQPNSPCINAGNNAYVTTTTDLDGRPRIVGGTVDIGAYEFQPGVSGAFIGWLQQYGLPTDGSADYADPDHDGMNNWQEWICGTCPTNAQSVLRLVSATPAGTNITVTWQSVAGVNYFLERSTNLASPFMHLASFIMGQAGTTSYADTNAAGAGPLFYRVGVLPSGTN
jgi:hypothetical protein